MPLSGKPIGVSAAIGALVSQRKPVAITEFGCTTHRGAADLGGRGATIIEWGEDGRPDRPEWRLHPDEQGVSDIVLKPLLLFFSIDRTGVAETGKILLHL